jgi:hypothetical protein
MHLSGANFARFLASAEYQKWRARERSAYSALFLRGSIVCEEEESSGSRGSISKDLSLSHMSLDEDGANVFDSIDEREVRQLVHKDGWLTTLIARAETLPIGTTLLSSTRSGYPVVFVNNFYNRFTGLDKSDMLGRRWNCLLSADVDQTIMQSVYKAIKYGKALTAIVPSLCKSGASQSSALCLKPITDAAGGYTYMLGLHLPLADDSLERRSKLTLMIDSLAAVLPSALKQSADGAPLICTTPAV